MARSLEDLDNAVTELEEDVTALRSASHDADSSHGDHETHATGLSRRLTAIDWIMFAIGIIALVYILAAYFWPNIFAPGGQQPSIFMPIAAVALGIVGWICVRRSRSTEGQSSIDDLFGYLIAIIVGAILAAGIIPPRIINNLSNVAPPTEGPSAIRVEDAATKKHKLRINKVEDVRIMIEYPNPDVTKATTKELEIEIDPLWKGSVWTQKNGVDSAASRF